MTPGFGDSDQQCNVIIVRCELSFIFSLSESVDCRPLVDRSSADCWPLVGRLLVVSRPSVGR